MTRFFRSHRLRLLNVAALLAVVSTGCSNAADNLMTAPSLLPDSLDAHGGSGGNARYYGAIVTPTSVAAGSTTSFSVTITNCNGVGTCDGAHASADNQQIGHVTIAIPASFTGVANVAVTTSDPADSWTASVAGGVIAVNAPAGNKRLAKGESVTVTFDAVAPCEAGVHEWATAAYQDTLVGDTDTPYTLAGVQPSVAVTGSCVTACTTRGQGFWEHHPEDWPAIGDGLALGNRVYNATELMSILQKNAVAGNGLIALAHQMIAARLNIANGDDGSSIAAVLAAADALIGDAIVPPVGTGSLFPGQTGSLTDALEAFNDRCEE